jgi:molybdopterin converting factor small subunit
MRVKLFAALRDIAGASELDVDASDVATLREDLSAKFGEEFARILAAGAVIVDGEKAGPGRNLEPDDEVALLPPVSGG